MADKTWRKPSYTIEILTLICYTCAVAFIMYFHEPWFDEAQAWLIARDATIKELLTSITHYEGHPPVWYLILMPLAKLGVPFEWGIKSVNLALAATAMGLVIFKAPFPRIVRCILPFTYFFFYQYGVISRSYSLMMLGFVLSALFYKNRQAKPFRFVLGLAIICGASAYGIVLAASIALVWLAEIIGWPIRPGRLRNLIKDRRAYALLALFLFNVLLFMTLYPYPDTYARQISQQSSFITRLFYMLFIAPADATCSLSHFGNTIQINWNTDLITSFIIGCVMSMAVSIITMLHKKLSLFLLSYLFLALFGAFVRFSTYYAGVIALFYLFLFWCCFCDKPEKDVLPVFLTRIVKTAKDRRYIKNLGLFLLGIVLCVSIFWTLSSSYHEVLIQYGTGRAAAAFLKENNLADLKIMTAWQNEPIDHSHEVIQDFNMVHGVSALPYFKHNLFMNLNGGQDNRCYLTHKIDVQGLKLKNLKVQGYPDILYDLVDLRYVYNDELTLRDYALVKIIQGSTIWKSNTYLYDELIFIRRDLLETYQSLTEITEFAVDESVDP